MTALAARDLAQAPSVAPAAHTQEKTPPIPAFASVWPKLTISDPGDRHEQEAERIADNLTDGRGIGVCGCIAGELSPCAECTGTPATKLDRKAVRAGRQSIVGPLDLGAGERLPDDFRTFAERRLGVDLEGVRVHVGREAARAADSLAAQAFTHGVDIAFAAGQYHPGSSAGRRLIAHELAHVVQHGSTRGARPTAIARQSDTGPGPQDAGPTELPQATTSYFTETTDTSAAGYGDVSLRALLVGDALQELRNLAARRGARAPLWFATWLEDVISRVETHVHPIAGMPDETEVRSLEHLRDVAAPVYQEAVSSYRRETQEFERDFYRSAQTSALAVLQANEVQARSEILRYGLTRNVTTEVRYEPTDEGPMIREENPVAHYAVERGNPSAQGIGVAARILLDRRKEIKRIESQRDHALGLYGYALIMSNMLGMDTSLADYARTLAKLNTGYAEVRAALSARYPALAAFSRIDQDLSALETLASDPQADSAAVLLGTRIFDQLDKINTVRDGITDPGQINLWCQPKIVGLTRASTGADLEPWKSRVVADRVEEERPGWLANIALAVFNLLALATAGITGGLSLVVAAGVNSAVAVGHVQEYLRNDALTGTAFDIAQAVSQDEPSLFWLAVEIAGVVGDVAGAGGAVAKTFGALKNAAKGVRVAKIEADALAAEEALLEAARNQGLTEVTALKIVEDAKAMRRAESGAAELAGLNPAEAAALTESESVAAGSKIGLVPAGTVSEYAVSRTGYLYTCSSPCRLLRDRYALILAQDSKGLGAEFAQLETEAKTIAAARHAAEIVGDAKGVATADAKVQGLTERLRAIEPRIRAQSPERLARVSWIASLEGGHPLFKRLLPGALERVVQKAPSLDHMRGQLLEELISARLADKTSREAAAGGEAVMAAAKSSSEIEFIPGHLIKDADGQLFTDGILAYRDGDRWHVVAVVEAKAGPASAKGLKTGWGDIPRPAGPAEALVWRSMGAEQLSKLAISPHRTDRDLAARIVRWKEVRAEAIEDLRATGQEFEQLSSAALEAKYQGRIDALMNALPRSESGQGRKSLERLLPNADAEVTGIRIGKEQADGTVFFTEGTLDRVTGSVRKTKVIGIVPDDVKGRSLLNIGQHEGIEFQLMNDLDVRVPDLVSAVESLAAAAKLAL